MSRGPISQGPILFLGCLPFGPIRQRPHHLAEEMARGGKVLYVEPHRSLLRRPEPTGSRVAPAARRGPLEILTPPPALPFSGYLPAVNRWNYARTAGRIRRRLLDLGWQEPRAIVAGFPKQVDLLDHFADVPVCYDVMDDYPLFFGLRQRAVIARLHRRLLRRADVVAAASDTLAERCRGVARRIVRVANGVSPAFHEACATVEADPAVLALPAPRLGYVGTIDRWLDFDVLGLLARAFPEGSVVVVGPETRAAPELPPNVHLVGGRPHDALPAILRALDAGLVPFKRTPLTDAVNPVKVYEYLSAGLHVLSADIAGVAEFGEMVSVCTTPDAWVSAARQAVGRSTRPGADARRTFAANHLWPDRARAILQAIEEAGAARG